jgi:Na+/H+-dicarboxylate symporter
MSDAARAFAALVGGLVLGLFARLVPSAAAGAGDLIEPLGLLWSNAIRLSVIPLACASIVVAILQTKDLGSLGRMGGRTLGLAALCLGLGAAASLGLAHAVLGRTPVGADVLAALQQRYPPTAAGTAGPTAVGDWVAQLLPANPVKALAEGTLLPIVTATIAFAAAARQVAASQQEILLRIAGAIADVAMVWIRWMLKVAPVGIFALVFPLTVRSGAGIASALLYYVGTTVGLCLVVAAGMYALVWSTRVVPVGGFARSAATAQILGFTSRSSMAALPLMIEASRDRLRLPDEVSHALLPLLVSVFRATASVAICVGVAFVAWLYGVDLRPDQLATAGLLSILLGVAMPGIPGAGVLATAPVLTAVGLPAEAVPVLLAVDAVGDMFRTGTNVTAHLALAVFGARVLRPSGAGGAAPGPG